MSDPKDGTATETGVQNTDKEHKQEKSGDSQMIPYARFQEVNLKRKAAEDTLAAIVEELRQDVPEDMRGLIPDLSAAEKIKWLREARSKGLFNPAGVSSPDARRPISKPSENLDNLSPVAMMAQGYNK